MNRKCLNQTTTSQNYRQILPAFHKTSKDKGWYQSSFPFSFLFISSFRTKHVSWKSLKKVTILHQTLCLEQQHNVDFIKTNEIRGVWKISKNKTFSSVNYSKLCLTFSRSSVLTYVDNNFSKLPLLLSDPFFSIRE